MYLSNGVVWSASKNSINFADVNPLACLSEAPLKSTLGKLNTVSYDINDLKREENQIHLNYPERVVIPERNHTARSVLGTLSARRSTQRPLDAGLLLEAQCPIQLF